MIAKSLSGIKWLCFAAFALLLASYLPALAQTPTPPAPREALTAAIQARAQRDVELGKPPEGIAGLQVLFGAEVTNAGMTMAEVLDVYETAYQTVTPAKPWWDPLRPLFTGAGLLALAYVVFDKLLKDYLTQFVTWLGKRAYIRLAGFRPFWGFALNKYRRRIPTERVDVFFAEGYRIVYAPSARKTHRGPAMTFPLPTQESEPHP